MRIYNELNIPLDSDLFDRLTCRIKNLEQENAHLKLQLKEMADKKMCQFSIKREPEIIEHRILTPILNLASFCSINTESHPKHVICKILNNDVITFAYYIDPNEYKNAPLDVMMSILAELHKNLINEILSFYMGKIDKEWNK